MDKVHWDTFQSAQEFALNDDEEPIVINRRIEDEREPNSRIMKSDERSIGQLRQIENPHFG